MVTIQRHLTPEAKVRELLAWERARTEFLAGPPPDRFIGGHGYHDPPIFPHVDALNAIDGVCTLQSCSGHRCTAASHCSWCAENTDITAGGDEGAHVSSGQLWLWLSGRMSRRFHQRVFYLAMQPLVEKVSVHYHVEGKEIVDLVFRGHGTGELDSAMRVIVPFFQELSSCQ